MTNENVSNAINLLGNPDFQTPGTSIATGKYQLGSPWVISDTSIYGASGFREDNNNNSHDNSSDPDCFIWRTDGGYKDKYFYQPVTGLVANGKYKIRFRTAENTNGPGIFSLRLGSTPGGAEYSKASITVEKGTAKINVAELTTSSLEANSYFSVYNEANCGVNDINKSCCRIDYIMLCEANAVSAGITGVTSGEYVEDDVYPTLPNGTDMTSSYITNAAVANKSGWTNGREGSNQQYTGAPDNTYLDTWNGTLDQKQTITLPAGYYLLKVATRAGTNVTDGNIYAYANGANLNSAQIHKEGNSGNLLDNGWAWTRVPFYISTVTNVTIGFYSVCNSGKWAGADDFTLIYYDSQANLDAAMLAGAKADATVWKTKLSGSTTTAALEAIQTEIEDASATVSSVEASVTTARSLVNAYSEYVPYKKGMDAVALVTATDPSAAASRKSTYLDPLATEGEEATTVEALNTAKANIKTAVLNYIKKLTPADAENAPFDLTFMITNPSFSANTMTGWDGTTPNFGNDATQKAAYACEYFQKEFDINQTLTGMATGNYRLKVKAYQRPGASDAVVTAYVNAADQADGTFGTSSEIYVNGGNEASQKIKNAASPMISTAVGKGNESKVTVSETDYYIPNDMVSAVAYFNAGHYENVANITATTTTIKFGFRSTATPATADWTIFDDFRLYYTGQLDLSTFQASLDAKVNEANELKATLSSSIPAAALEALQTAIDNNDNDDDTFAESEQFTEAIENIQTAMDAANALVTPYANYTALRTAVQNLYDVANYDEIVADAHSTLNSALSTAATNVADATTVDAINAVTTTLKAAGITYAGNANPTGSDKFNLTFMLTNPDLSSFNAWTKVDAVDGWYSDMADGNQQVMKNDGVACSKGNAFFEYWSEVAKANNEFALYNKVENLAKGTYTMSCFALATANGVAGATTSKVYFYANDTQGSLVSADVLTEQTISFVNTTTQDVKIGLKPLTGNEFRWMGIGYVELYKVPEAAPVELDESRAYDYSYEGAATAKLTREIYEGFNTVMLPFSLSASEITTVFGSGTLYGFTGADAGSLNFVTSPTLAANTPYLFKADAKKSLVEVEIEARTFVAADAAQVATAGTDYNFVGTYTPYEKNGVGNPIVIGTDYVLGADDNFHLTTTQNALKAFRAYIQANEASPVNPVKALNICIDGETTAIESLNGETMTDGAIYNMAGQRVNKAVKGLYIVNGKKILVK